MTRMGALTVLTLGLLLASASCVEALEAAMPGLIKDQAGLHGANKFGIMTSVNRTPIGDPNEPEDTDNSRIMSLAARQGDDTFCMEREYLKRTMKLVKEMPFIGLFHDLQSQRRFEGSGMVLAKDYYYIIFDSLRAIGKVGQHLNFRGDDNVLIGGAEEFESQYEGITYCNATDTFILVRESWVPPSDPDALVPLTEEVRIAHDSSDYELLRKCPIDFQLEDVNKGFESISYFEENGERYVIGLCESNYCKTIQGDDPPGKRPGNGRVVVARFKQGARLDLSKGNRKLRANGKRELGPIGTVYTGDDTDCVWEFVKLVKLPEQAYFTDYAGIAFRSYKSNRVAVVSQEDSAVWVGDFDWTEMMFEKGGKVYHLPRDNHCNKVFCNVEGIQFIDDERLVLASDAAKTSVQPFHCMAKDQTIHVVGLP